MLEKSCKHGIIYMQPQTTHAQAQGDIMKVDSEISRAVERYLHENELTYEEFSRRMGVSPASITKWRKVGNGITSIKWAALFPLIKKYLPEDRIFIDDSGKEQYSSATEHQSSYVFEPKYLPQMVPIFQLDSLKGFDNTLESVIQFAKKNSSGLSEYRPKHSNISGVFAVDIDDNSLAPVIPAKTRIFACTSEKPHNNGLVIANPASADVAIIGRYSRNGSQFFIHSVCDNTVLLSGETTDARALIVWIFRFFTTK